MSDIEDVAQRLFDAIDSADIKAVRTIVDDELYPMVMHERDAVNWMAQPANLTKLHKALMEKLDIPQKLLMLRNRIPGTHRRSVMFVKAISNALKRVDEE